MPREPQPSVATNLIMFNEIAAARGDGLHPRIGEALMKTGRVSGPPAKSPEISENIIKIVFSDTNKSARKIGTNRA